eukprot:gene27479-33892_t
MSTELSGSAIYGHDGDTDGSAAQSAIAERNPWWQIELDGQHEVFNVTVSNRPGSCASRLLRGSECGEEFPRGAFEALDEGAVIGVSLDPCSGDWCYGVECGRISESSASHQYTVECGGAVGSYVYLLLPGDERILNFQELQACVVPDTGGYFMNEGIENVCEPG